MAATATPRSDHPPVTAPPLDEDGPSARATTARIVQAALAFLAALSPAHFAQVLCRFDDREQRGRWSNAPAHAVPRGGLRLADLDADQRHLAMDLLGSMLSRRGGETVERIRTAEQRFATSGRARDPQWFDAAHYHLALLGTPSVSEPWILQVGGYHLALHLTVHGEQGYATPLLTGTEPGAFEQDGRTIRPLGAEQDRIHALLTALDPVQHRAAEIAGPERDLLYGPHWDGTVRPACGLSASTLAPAQRELLLAVIETWLGMLPATYAAPRLAEIAATLDRSWLGWSTARSRAQGLTGTPYLRIQGPALLLEYSPLRGDDHAHTILRDPQRERGPRPWPT